jgi:phage terminase large subunit
MDEFKVTERSIVNTINGSDFLFKGLHRNEQSVKSTEGIDIAWVEEAQTVSQAIIEVLTPKIRKEGSQIIYTYNRLEEADPVHVRLVIEGRPNTLIINANYDVALKYNFMPDVIKLEMEDDRDKRPDLYKHKWLGEPLALLESRIYKGWNIIDVIPKEARLERRGLDFGYTNDPSSIISIYKYNGGYIWDEELYQKGMSNKQLADTLKALEHPHTLVIADSSEPKSIDEIKNYGVPVIGAVKGQGSVNQGIQLIQGLPISITKRSQKTIEEYRKYLWKTDKEDNILNTPIDLWNHSMDSGRYAMQSLYPHANTESVTELKIR